MDSIEWREKEKGLICAKESCIVEANDREGEKKRTRNFRWAPRSGGFLLFFQNKTDVVFVDMFSKQRCGHLFQSDLRFAFGVERDCVKSRFCGVRNRILIQAMMRVNDGVHG